MASKMGGTEGSAKLHQCGNTAFAVTGLYHPHGSVNAGFIVASRSIVHIDAGMRPADGRHLLELSAKIAPGRENLYLILTHHHTDHIFGMRTFRERGAKIIGHRMLEKFIARLWLKSRRSVGEIYQEFVLSGAEPSREEAAFLPEVELTLPDEVFEGDTILKIDGEEIHLLYTPGHVPSEISVYHPASRTLFAGDMIYEGIPLTTRFGGPQEWEKWIESLERLQALEIERVAPGHGRICSPEEIERNIAYLRGLLGA